MSDPRDAGRDAVVLDHTWRIYGDVVAVRDLSLVVRRGEFLTLLGPSGSGKTTVLMMLAGFIAPSRGDIFINGRSVRHVPPQRRGVGVVYQSYALFPHMTVFDNVAFPLDMRHVPRDDKRRRVNTALDLVGLSGLERRFPRQLSGGQQQRVALARATVFEPQLLVMDEPLGALDRKMRVRMQFELKDLQRRLGVTVIYVTHDQEEALTMSDRIAALRNGSLEQIGTPAELYESPATVWVADFLGESNFLYGTVDELLPDYSRVLTTEGFGFLAARREDFPAGARVVAAIRPEQFRIGSATRDRQNKCVCRVEEVLYVGDIVRYRMLVVDRSVSLDVKVHSAAGPMLHVGEQTEVSWSPAATRLLLPPTTMSDGDKDVL